MKVYKEEVLTYVPALANKYVVLIDIADLEKMSGLIKKPVLFPNNSKLSTGNWYPAVSVTNNFANVKTDTSDMLFTVETPVGFDPLTLSISFVDNVDLALKKFFKTWMQRIVVDSKKYTVGLVKDICAKIFIYKYTEGAVDYTDVDGYFVYPKGELSEDLQSDSGNPYLLQVSFVVAGTIDI